MSLNCSEIQEVFRWVRVQAILKIFLLSSSVCQEANASSNWPVRGAVKFWPKFWCQVVKSYCSTFFDSSCRSNLIINFDTPRQSWLNIPGSISIHFRSTCGIDTGDDVKVGVGRGLAFATGCLVHLSQRLQQESLLSFRLRICWCHSRHEPNNKFCHEIRIRSWSRHRNVLDDNRPSPPGLDRSSCFHGSTLSPRMIHHFDKVFSRHDAINLSSVSSSSVMKNCPFYSSRNQHWRSRVWWISLVQEDLRISAHIHAINFLELRHQS